MITNDLKNANKEAKLPTPKVRKDTDRVYKRKTNKQLLKEAKTPQEKQAVKAKIKQIQAKKNLTRATTQLQTIADNSPSEKVKDILPPEMLEENVPIADDDVIFKPNPGKQTDFLAASEEEVFYGGGKGGGKTYGLIADPLRYCHNPNHSGLYVRRTMSELRDIIHHTRKIYPKVFPGAKFNTLESCWNFPSGARQEFGYAENLKDTLRYQGKAYNWIGFDELPQYEDARIYENIKSCARSVDPELPIHIRATGNSGNIGSNWLKEEFIDPAEPNTTFHVPVEYFDRNLNKNVKKTITRRFIPSTVWDNPYLLHDDKYLTMLASLPEVKRRQLLEGDWDVNEYSAFPEYSRNGPHVIDAFDIPKDWSRFRAADWGYATPFCCLWFAVDYDGNIYVYREYYGKGVVADDWARNIALLEGKEPIIDALIDGSTNIRRGERGPTIFETINGELRKALRRPFRFADRSPDSRIAGKQEVHRRLALRPTGLLTEEGEHIKEPTLFFFRNCTNLIRTMAALKVDENDQEKVDKKCEDHAYDALHYGLRSRPVSPYIIQDMNRFRETNKPVVADPTFGY